MSEDAKFARLIQENRQSLSRQHDEISQCERFTKDFRDSGFLESVQKRCEELQDGLSTSIWEMPRREDQPDASKGPVIDDPSLVDFDGIAQSFDKQLRDTDRMIDQVDSVLTDISTRVRRALDGDFQTEDLMRTISLLTKSLPSDAEEFVATPYEQMLRRNGIPQALDDLVPPDSALKAHEPPPPPPLCALPTLQGPAPPEVNLASLSPSHTHAHADPSPVPAGEGEAETSIRPAAARTQGEVTVI
eukprot:gnl/Trimastix_PCT/3404.p1 GENE.gnl/Trimastix_PCT/3404~~gnl/Trimastix_PCT/3404.p1  ORF type:complete len:246 (+),score=57.08 gnl/Trimastix_PCT/3404:86-823(+)